MTCECANLEWDESMYHLEHHPKCTVFIRKTTDGILDLLHQFAEMLEAIKDVEPVDCETAQKLAQETYNEYTRPVGGASTIWTYNGEITFPPDMTAEDIQKALEKT